MLVAITPLPAPRPRRYPQHADDDEPKKNAHRG
jgi:hypothetical protein